MSTDPHEVEQWLVVPVPPFQPLIGPFNTDYNELLSRMKSESGLLVRCTFENENYVAQVVTVTEKVTGTELSLQFSMSEQAPDWIFTAPLIITEIVKFGGDMIELKFDRRL